MASELTEMGSHVWRTVSDGHNSFDVKIRLPTYEDRLHEQVLETQYALSGVEDRMQVDRERIEARMEMVVGWREVFGDDGNQVPFTRDNLHLLVALHPMALLSVVDTVGKLLRSDLSDTAKKN